MLYYRVKTPGKTYRYNGYMQTVRNELFTPGEAKHYSIPDECGCRLHEEWLEPVEESRASTYWLFGARFGKLGPRD